MVVQGHMLALLELPDERKINEGKTSKLMKTISKYVSFKDEEIRRNFNNNSFPRLIILITLHQVSMQMNVNSK